MPKFQMMTVLVALSHLMEMVARERMDAMVETVLSGEVSREEG